MSTPTAITVLLADDHPIWVDGLTAVLHREGFDTLPPVMELVGIAPALAAHPQVALLDMTFGRETLLDVIPALQAASPGTVLLGVTAHASRAMAEEGLRRGLHGYLAKSLPTTELLAAIRAAVAGTLQPRIQLGAGYARGPSMPGRLPGITLSARQTRLLEVLMAGHTQAETAVMLGVTAKTVEYHISEIRRRTGLESLAAVLLWAREAGFLPDDPMRLRPPGSDAEGVA